MATTTPICRCRVLYLGSQVPHATKDGLQGIQEPLRELYPEQGPLSARGIDSWLSVWSNGLLLENVDDSLRQVTRFFPIETLHYCAAVRYVVVPAGGGETPRGAEKFLPLDSPFARRGIHPPLFACILRRTSGIKVLECHAFICKKEAAANALVRCCFHAYADSMYARQLEDSGAAFPRRARSMSGLNTLEKVTSWKTRPTENEPAVNEGKGSDLNSLGPEDDNYKVWSGQAPTEREMVYMDSSGTIRSVHSAVNGGLKPPKPRQMILPSRPPPAPASAHGTLKDKNKNKLFKSKSSSKKSNGYDPHVYMNGHARPKSAAELYPPPSRMALSPDYHPPYMSAEHYHTERLARRPPVLAPVPIPLDEPPIYGTASRINGEATMPKKKKEKTSPESPFNTGIYRKKGHLNERAFSESIRQEHRSRSNSLANLQFFDPRPESIDDKKECELVQMVNSLDISSSSGFPYSDSNFTKKKANGYKR